MSESDYTVVRCLAQGNFGAVRLCCRNSDGWYVVLKNIAVEDMPKEERLAALTEVKVLKGLQHPNIIHYHDSFVQAKDLVIVMEHAGGGSLHEYIKTQPESLPEDTILKLFVQVVKALDYIHARNILHRDLKSHNIFLDTTHKVIKLGDFGISKVVSSQGAQTVVGTPSYMAPEICEGLSYNMKADVWALGCVLYEMASRSRAFEAPSMPALIIKIMEAPVQSLPPMYSGDLQRLVNNMLSREPQQRPSARDILCNPIVQLPSVHLTVQVLVSVWQAQYCTGDIAYTNVLFVHMSM
eukprot:m.136245 g.136245  ORF g.136245 m.136245 type:complete len:296 (-) comp13993_c0_seq10:463-1350(-)